MEEIEVNIKLQENNKIYNIPIRKSDKISQLKEYCKIISNIPPAEQYLVYKEKILSDEKFVNDYNIENNQNILLAKKVEELPENIPLIQNPDFLKFLKTQTDNKDIDFNEVANLYKQIDLSATFFNYNIERADDYCQAIGLGSLSDIFGIEKQEHKKFLKVLNHTK